MASDEREDPLVEVEYDPSQPAPPWMAGVRIDEREVHGALTERQQRWVLAKLRWEAFAR